MRLDDAFSVAYMLANPVWGRVLDRVGVFAGMLAAVALWSAASARTRSPPASSGSPRFAAWLALARRSSPSANAVPAGADRR